MWVADLWDVIDSNQHKLALEFVSDLEKQLGLRHTKISVRDEWSKAPPKEAVELDLQEFMTPVINVKLN